jgi:hypothetical protein
MTEYALLKWLLIVVDTLVGIALACLAIFSIYFWIRAIVRSLSGRDWYTGLKDKIA